ncbi:MAG TPA: pantothenate kinase [Flavobacteriales bacterium]|nr:pantothenate kinase [Flavobacteriales bacterium]
MQLAVDIGNSRTKYAVFDREELIRSEADKRPADDIIKDCLGQYPKIKSLIISSVNHQIDPESISIPESIRHMVLDHGTPIPIKNNYQSPETLGHDRIALAVAVGHRFPGRNALVIDIGTCVTYDLVDRHGTYRGGRISPGLGLRFSSLHTGTARLPLVELDKSGHPHLLGKDTASCIQSGVVQGLSNEISGTIKQFEKEFKDLKIMLTGGDYKLFDKALKISIFADPNAVLRGLNQILLYNLSDE